jgi:hypothetical protein
MWTCSLNRGGDKNYEHFAAAQSRALSKVVIAVNQSRDPTLARSRLPRQTAHYDPSHAIPDLRVITRRIDVALATNNEYLAEENW